ncbi:RICIN domain-containing protein [Streptomyces sp. NPDC001339]|uniref:RICIN domain-containing protein n=1 Tax=Streptomyces sp. NPDC001339 TaxID=3364563 RepID=UPI003677EADD
MARIIRAALAATAGFAALAGGATTAHAEGAAAQSAAPRVETVVQLQNEHSGKCLDIGHPDADGSLTARQYACDGSDAQKWRVIPTANSSFELRSKAGGKCLEVRKSNTAKGAEVWQWACNSGKHQRWQFQLIDSTKKLFQLSPTHTEDRCVGIGNSSVEDGGRAIQWTCNQTTPGQWRILPAT